MKSTRKVLMLTVVFLIILGILHFGSTWVLATGQKGVLKVALHWVVSAGWLDPATTPAGTSSQAAVWLLHESLVKAMPGNRYTPCVAESWTFTPDYKVFEFKLRKGVKFHNGDEVTAEDVVFTFERYKANAAALIKNKIQKLEAVNSYLFRVTFKEPFFDFLDYFLPGMSTIGYITPKKYIEKVGEEGYKRHPIGCGPYKFVEFKPGIRLVGEAFEDFWRKVPKIKRIELSFVKSHETRYAMLKKGEVDYVTRMAGVFYEKLKKEPNLRMSTPAGLANWIINITTQWDSKSPWSNPLVRKATSLAIDRKTISDIFFPGGPQLGSLGLPGFPGNLERPPDPYDPEQAKKLMAQAGYPNGFHGGKFYPFPGAFLPMGEQIVNYWKAIGISVDTVQLGRADWKAKRRYGKFKGGVFCESVNEVTVAGRLGYLIGGGNYCYGNYPEIKALWDQFTKSIDPKVREDLIMRMQELINEKTMYIYMVQTTVPMGVGPRVKGNPFKLAPLIYWAAPYEDIELID